MKGINVLGEIVGIVNCATIKSFGGWTLLFLTIFLGIIFVISKSDFFSFCVFLLAIISASLSTMFFITDGKEQYTNYLIHLTDEASYNEFNATYEIVDEICDGYYEVKLKDFNGDIND